MPPLAPRSGLEVELKLHVEREDLARLSQHPRVRELTRERPIVQALESVYYDTQDFDLANAGLVLRLRSGARSTVQTVKTRGEAAAGLFSRGEWETPIPGESPDIVSISDSAVRSRIMQAVCGKALAPVVRTLVRRTRCRIGTANWEALFDLDVGEAKTLRGSLPICELELELIHGDPGALYDLALEIHESIPLRPLTMGKAELGLSALLGETPAPRRAQSPELDAGATLEDALSATVASCITQIAANEAPARKGADPEGVHQMRVGIRRLRSALALFREVIPEAQRETFGRELRWLGGELGDARDLDVFQAETLETVVPHLSADSVLGHLPEIADPMRREAYARVTAALDSRRYTGLLLSLGAWSAGGRWRAQPLTPNSARLFAPAREVGSELLARRYSKARRNGRRIRELTFAEAHRLRIQCKKLRYATDFLGSLYPSQTTHPFTRQLGRLQDILGHLNDQSTAERLLERALDRLDPDAAARHQRAAGFVLGWTSRMALEKLQSLEKDWKRFAKLEIFWKQ